MSELHLETVVAPLTTNPCPLILDKRHYLLMAALLFTSLFFSNPTKALTEEFPDREPSEVKAAYLYKFLGFVEWPREEWPAPTLPLTVGVLGLEDSASYLQQIVASRNVNGHPIAVRNFKLGDSLEDVHVLYIGRIDKGKLGNLTSRAQQLSIFTVCEADDGIDNGCVINFVLDDGRIRFDVSLDVAQSSKLELSSRMLAVAHRVKTGGK